MQLIIYLFILELFFGLNGKLLVLGGISIRHWLFAVVLFFVFLKAVLCFLGKWNEKKGEQISFVRFFMSEWTSFSGFDYVLLVFLALHAIWIVVIPYLQLDTNPGALSTALGSGLSISIMLLYYPAVYLLRNGKIKWEKYRSFVMGCFVAIAIWHIVVYVLEKIQWNQDHTYYFMERIFMWWEQVVGGYCEVPKVLMPKYAVRIIYGCNIFLPMSFYFIVGQKKKRYFLWTLLGIAALFTTGTRSLIVGTLAGVCVFLVLDFLLHRRDGAAMKQLLLKAVAVLVTAIVMDGVLFQGMNVTRLAASFSISEEAMESGTVQRLEWDNSEYSVENELRGTTNSNTTRLLQLKSLWTMFKERPFWGHGFTLGVYDMQGFAYIVKVGLFGILLWGIFLGASLVRVIRMERVEKNSALPAVYVVTAVLIDVMLQCLFGSLTMAMAVFVFLDLEEREMRIAAKEVIENVG